MDLTTKTAINQLYEQERHLRDSSRAAEYASFIREVHDASPEALRSPELQLKLWEDKSISGSGMCSIDMSDFAHNEGSVDYVVQIASEELPDNPSERIERLESYHARLTALVRDHKKRMPKLKVLRLLAALFPFDMTRIVGAAKLRKTLRRLGVAIPTKASPVRMNRILLDHISDVIGPCGDQIDDAVERSMFAWTLYEEAKSSSTETENPDSLNEIPSELTFPPGDSRWKGIPAISGYVDTAIKIVGFAQNGITPSELAEVYQQEAPNLKLNSAKKQLSVIRQYLGLLRLENNVLTPTELGDELADSREPGVLVERLITRIIGFDVILFELNEKGSLQKADIFQTLRSHYPNWTTDRAPASLLKWSESLELVDVSSEQNVTLTEMGKQWAALVTERPTAFSATSAEDEKKQPSKFLPPSFSQIVESIQASGYVFSLDLLAKFHTALHMHETKHFVLLSGLSGTGKTKLAQLYADAFHGIERGQINDYFLLVPVQPDWTDATGLMGYVNPLQQETTYEPTSFLHFLHRAAALPDRPHFVCLDEMNLARVEYYFAPFLSAMESGSPIIVHQQDEPIDTVEPEFNWPKNLFIIGTVNMDETTHAFSDKVLDRAFTLEFWEVDLQKYHESFKKRYPDVDDGLITSVLEKVRRVHEILHVVNLHFGYRVIDEVLLFVAKAVAETGEVLPLDKAIDCSFQMKILPKLRGEDTPAFRKCFEKLIACLGEMQLTDSKAKCQTMSETLLATGATQYWR